MANWYRNKGLREQGLREQGLREQGLGSKGKKQKQRVKGTKGKRNKGKRDRRFRVKENYSLFIQNHFYLVFIYNELGFFLIKTQHAIDYFISYTHSHMFYQAIVL